MTPSKTRNRPPRPKWTPSGITAALWKADPSRVQWAQSTPHFNDLVAVLVNERDALLTATGATFTENARYGLSEGYALALRQLRDLALGASPDLPPTPPQDYAPDNDLPSTTVTD